MSIHSKTIFVHDYFPKPYPPTIEYFLPCKEIPSNVRHSLNPWLQQMIGSDPEVVRNVLKRRWGDISINSLVQLRDLFLGDFEPQSIFTHENDAWLGLGRPDRIVPDSGDVILIPPPPDTKKIERLLSKSAW